MYLHPAESSFFSFGLESWLVLTRQGGRTPSRIRPAGPAESSRVLELQRPPLTSSKNVGPTVRRWGASSFLRPQSHMEWRDAFSQGLELVAKPVRRRTRAWWETRRQGNKPRPRPARR